MAPDELATIDPPLCDSVATGPAVEQDLLPAAPACAVTGWTAAQLVIPALQGPNVGTWLAGKSLLVEPAGNCTLGYRFAKRVLDIVGALVLLVLLSPMMLTTYLVLLVTARGKPLFKQRRVGQCGKLFSLYKFRTMHLNAGAMQAQVDNEKDGPIFKNRRDPRITRLGRLLRSLSIDETPQVFNVLLGSMALVGPRPPLVKEVAQYKPWQLKRLAVKPGLTCLWQVSGRSEIGFEDWVRMDIWYIENQELITDLKLLAATPGAVLSRRGAY